MITAQRDVATEGRTRLIERIEQLRHERNAVILAHNYQRPEVQDIADFVGDSLGLSQQAAATDASVIVFCGVHFMAETAAILSPEKTVLLPDLEAGCSLAATIDADQLRAWRAEYPGAVVVSYVNTTAEVKALSDYCCTSSNAEAVIRSIPADREILFCPDMFLGAHLERVTGRKMHVWMGECHVHAGIVPSGSMRCARSTPTPSCWFTPSAGAPRRRSIGCRPAMSPARRPWSPQPRAWSAERPNRRHRPSSLPPRSASCTACRSSRPASCFSPLRRRRSALI